MNLTYRTVFNRALGLWQAVSEWARTGGRTGSIVRAMRAHRGESERGVHGDHGEQGGRGGAAATQGPHINAQLPMLSGPRALCGWGRGRSRARGLSASALAAGMLGLSAPLALVDLSHAQCLPTQSPASNDSVTCTGATTTPVIAQSGSNHVTVTLSPGASLTGINPTSGAYALISVNAISDIINNGSLFLGGAGATTARGVAMMGNASSGGDESNHLYNYGSITTTGPYNVGMAAAGGGNLLVNGKTGVITTDGQGSYGMSSGFTTSGNIAGVSGNTVTNTGVVKTTGVSSRAVSVIGSNNVVNNNQGALLESDGNSSNAVYLNGTLDEVSNSGTIKVIGNGSNAVNVNMTSISQTTKITNFATGLIVNNYNGASVNQGNAVNISTGAAKIINYGRIQSDSASTGNAIAGNTGSSIDLTLETGSSLVGTVLGGDNSSYGNTLTLDAPASPANANGAVNNAFVNFKSLTVLGANWSWTAGASAIFDTTDIQGGALNINNGGTLTTKTASTIASNPGVSAGVIVSGSASNWTNLGSLIVGAGGAGFLTLANGGVAQADSVEVATSAGTGVINIGAAQGQASALPGLLLDKAGGPNPPITLGVGGAIVFNHSQTSSAYIFGSLIDGAGSVTVVNGVTALTAMNKYQGNTTLSGGVLQISSDNNLGLPGAGNLFLDGGILESTAPINTARAVSITAKGGAIQTDAGSDVTISSPIVDAATVTSPPGGSLSKTGPGALILTAQNTYSGATLIKGGALELVGANASIAQSAGVQISTGAILDASQALAAPSGVTLQSLAGDAGSSVAMGANALVLQNPNATVGNDFEGSIAGSGDLVIETGTEILSGANLYTGATQINGGTLALTGSGSIDKSSGVALASGATLDVSGLAGAPAATQIQALAGSSGSAIKLGSNTLEIANPNAAFGNVFGGVISGAGGVQINGGEQTFSGINTYTGGTTVTGATLKLTGAGAINSSSGLALANGAVFDVSAIAAAPASVIFGSLTGESGTQLQMGSNTLVLQDPNSAFGNDFEGAIAGTGGLVINAGVQTLSGVNSYSGKTQVNSGKLALIDQGSIAASSGVALGAGATFDISGLPAPATAAIEALSGAAGSAVALGGNSLSLVNPNAGFGNVFAGAIVGGGSLAILGGESILTGSNTYTGPTTIAQGATLTLGNGAAGGSIVSNVDNEGVIDFNRSDSYVFNPLISGAGALEQAGAGVTILTQDNTYTGGTQILAGTLQVGNGGVTGSAGLPGSGDIVIGQGASLAIDWGAAYVLPNALRSSAPGSGAVVVNAAGNAFDFASAAQGSAFSGVLELGAATFQLSGVNTAALAHATLDAATGSRVTVGAGVQTIGGLQIDGGTLVFNSVAPAINPSFIDTGALDVSSVGTIVLNVPSVLDLPPPAVPPVTSPSTIFAQSHVTSGLQLIAASAVKGTGAGLALKDQNGQVITDARTVSIDQNGQTVANGTYDYGLGTGAASDGLYVGYALKRVNMLGGQTLYLTEPQGASGIDADLAAQVSGSGNLVIAAGDALSLSNPTNDFTGSTVVQSGALVAGADQILAHSSAVTLEAGAAFQTNGYDQSLNNVNTALGSALDLGGQSVVTLQGGGAPNTINGLIQGTGSLVQGSGTEILTGANTYKGGTTVMGGSLMINGDQSGATGATTVQSGAGLGGSGIIGGNVTVASGGILAPSAGASTPATLQINGDLTLESGAELFYQLGKAGAAGGSLNDLTRVLGNLTVGGILNVTVSSQGTFDPGVYRLFTYGGSLTDNSMTIGSAPVALNELSLVGGGGNFNLVYDNSSTGGGGGDGGGGGGGGGGDGGITEPAPTYNFWNQASGTWNHTNANWSTASGSSVGPYTPNSFAVFQGIGGVVTVSAGSKPIVAGGMQFVNSGYTLTGDAIDLTETIAQSNQALIRVGDGTASGAASSATINAVLRGATGLDKEDLGALILGAANAYTGLTTVGAGSLVVAQTGSIAGDVTNKANFENDGAVAGGLSQSAGKAINNGAIAGPVQITGGLYTGVGASGSLTVGSGASFEPGSGVAGTTTRINGDLTLTGADYRVNISPSAASSTLVTGSATINGGAVQVLAGSGNYSLWSQYVIIEANGVSGAFGSVATNLAFLDPILSYDANHVLLTVKRNDVSFGQLGGSANQNEAGRGVESLGGGNPIYDSAIELDAPGALHAFDQLSGEIHASLQSQLIDDSRFPRQAILDRLQSAVGGIGGGSAPVMAFVDGKSQLAPANTRDGAVWMRALRSWGTLNGDGNASSLNRNITGLLMGADSAIDQGNGRLGMLAGYTHMEAAANAVRSSGKSDNYTLGLYGGGAWGAARVRAGAAYTWSNLTADRSVVYPGFSDDLQSSYNASTAQVFAQGSLALQLGEAGFEPFVNLAWVSQHSSAFTERGGAAALSGGSASENLTLSTLGVKASATLELGAVKTTLKGSLGWRHAAGAIASSSAMTLAGGSPFTISGVPIARDAALIDLGLEVGLSKASALTLSYDGQFGGGAKDNGVQVTFSMKF